MANQFSTIQYSFATGEVAPGIWNRKDWDRADSAVAKAKNALVGPTGSIRKRPGFRFVGEALHDDKPIQLVKFEFSVGQTYQLEFGDGIMRFYINNEMILTDSGEPYVLVTPYTAEQAQEFTFSQERDTMFFAHWDKPPKALVRYGHANWKWSDVFAETGRIASPASVSWLGNGGNGHNGYEYAITAYAMEGGTPKESINYPTIVSSPDDVDFIASAPQYTIQSCINWIKTYRGQYGQMAGFPTYPEVMDLSSVALDNQTPWGGNGYQAKPNEVAMALANQKLFAIFQAVYPSLYYCVQIYFIAPGSGISGNVWSLKDSGGNIIQNYLYMTGGSTMPEYANEVYSDSSTVILLNRAYSYLNSGVAVQGYTMPGIYSAITSFINTYNEANSQKLTNAMQWPGVAEADGYFVYRRPIDAEDRNFYRVGTIFGSETQYTDNIEETIPGTETPIVGENTFTSPEKYPRLVSFYQQRLVLGATKEKPTTIFGSRTGIYNDFTINPSDLSSGYEFMMASQTSNPLRGIIPLRTLYITTSGGAFVSTISGAMNAGNVNFNQQAYNGASDVPALILDTAAVYVPIGQQAINSLVYNYQEDGFADENMLFQAQHLTEEKTVVSLSYQRAPINLIWAALSDGSLLSCTYIPKQSFLAWTHHETSGQVQSINSVPNSQGFDELWAVVKRTLGDGTVKQYLEVLGDARPYGGKPNAENSFYVDCGLSGRFSEPMTAVSGLEHLEGLEVAILADFSVHEPKVVRNGQVDLDQPAEIVHVGLPYESEVETLNLELAAMPSPRTGRRQVKKCIVELEKCRELFYSSNGGKHTEHCVSDGDNLGYAPRLIDGDVEIAPRAGNTRGTRLSFKSPSPVPFGIQSLVAELEYGDQ